MSGESDGLATVEAKRKECETTGLLSPISAWAQYQIDLVDFVDQCKRLDYFDQRYDFEEARERAQLDSP